MAYGKWSCIKNTMTLWSIDRDICDEYLYFATLKKEFWPRRGAAQPFISQGDARASRILKPPSDIMSAFAKIARPALKFGHSLTQQIRNLHAQRDLLVHKLTSGEIDVSRFAAALPEAAD
jgi:type I restriction enzyme S subunit